ncbi:nitrile hydratase subunit alpha [Gloeocapsa sp. BRSZ]
MSTIPSLCEPLLIEKRMITSETVDKVINFFEKDMEPFNGAKAWVDPEFKQR